MRPERREARGECATEVHAKRKRAMASVCARKPLKRPRRLSAEEVKMLKLEVGTIGNVREVHPAINSEIWGKRVCDIWEEWVVWVEK